MDLLEEITGRALTGTPATIGEAMELNSRYSADELADAANRVRRERMGNHVDTCSIVNARSGHCTEDCKWCAQAACHHTGIEEYDIVPVERLRHAAALNDRAGVRRLSLVASGRKVSPANIRRFADMYRELGDTTELKLCASMGLLNREELQALYDAGVRRYHCNLETSSDYFPTLCTTHTHADKLRTIRAAREVGMEVCSGGIIGMGETMRQRLQLAVEARDAGAVSIPINLLQPIKGTPLEDTPLISEDEVIRTVALFRLIAPDVTLRFAGGRARLSDTALERIFRGGMNGSIVGDMLTTLGKSLAEDYALYDRLGLTH